jgi:hypothetical protein
MAGGGAHTPNCSGVTTATSDEQGTNEGEERQSKQYKYGQTGMID